MRFIVNIWPIAISKGYKDIIFDELNKNGTIIFAKPIYLNYIGLRNYMVQIYRHNKWSGNFRNHFRGIPRKLNACFYPDTPTYIIEYETDNMDSMLTCKQKIRNLCQCEKHSIHSSDTFEEYCLMKKILLHPPTIELINSVDMDMQRCFTKPFSRFLKLLDTYRLNPDNFLIISKAVYSLYGMKKENRLSWICKTPMSLHRKLDKLNKNEFNSLLSSFSEDIANPNHYISYCGVDFLFPEIIEKMEQALQ